MKYLLATALLIGGLVGAAAQPPGAPEGRRPPGPSGTFISPMGEPFRAPGQSGRDLMARWFAGADGNGDGRIRLAEMTADADRFFTSLDVDGDGEIAPVEIERYENEVAPEIRFLRRMGMGPGRRPPRRAMGDGPPGGGMGGMGGMGGRGAMGGGMGGGPPSGGMGGGRPRRPPGGGPFALLDLPQPVMAADADFNRGVSREEFRRAAGQRLVRLDRNSDGQLMLDELGLPPGRERQR